jgi:hypothetical protein
MTAVPRSAFGSLAAIRIIASIALGLSFVWSFAISLGLSPQPHRALFLDRWFNSHFASSLTCITAVPGAV